MILVVRPGECGGSRVRRAAAGESPSMQIANNGELVVGRWWRYSDYICLFIEHFNGLFHDDNCVLGGEGHPAHETAAQIRSCQAHSSVGCKSASSPHQCPVVGVQL